MAFSFIYKVTDYLIPISLLPDVVHHFEQCIMLDKQVKVAI